MGGYEGLGETARVIRRFESLIFCCILAVIPPFLGVTPIALYTLLFTGMVFTSGGSILWDPPRADIRVTNPGGADRSIKLFTPRNNESNFEP